MWQPYPSPVPSENSRALRTQEFRTEMPTAPASTLPAAPPVARRDPTPTMLHGVTLRDDYRWMRDKDSPEVIEYLNAENGWTAAAMEPTAELQATLYAEM